MTPARKQRKYSPIGLDVGVRCAKAIQLAWDGTAARVWRSCSVEWREGMDCPHAGLADALARAGFVGHTVVASVPSDRVVCERLELPPRSSGAPVEDLARAELARIMKAETDAFELAHWDIPAPARAGKTLHVMAIGCRHAESDQLLDALESQGLFVERLEPSVSAAARALDLGRKPDGGTARAVLDLGWSASTLFVTYRGVIAYHRRIAEAGLERVYGQLRDQLGFVREEVDVLLDEWDVSAVQPDADVPEIRAVVAPHLDALSSEIRTSCSYVAHQYPDAAPDSITLIGGGAKAVGFAGYLSRGLGLAVVPSSEDDGLEEAVRVAGPEWVAAFGLATGPAGGWG